MNDEIETTSTDAGLLADHLDVASKFPNREAREIKLRAGAQVISLVGLVPSVQMVQLFIRTIVLDSMPKAIEGMLKSVFPLSLKAPFEDLVEEYPFAEGAIGKAVLDWVGAAEEYCSIEEGTRMLSHVESGRLISWRKPARQELKMMERGVLKGGSDSTAPTLAIKRLLLAIVADDGDFAAWMNEQPGRFIPLFGAISGFEKGLCEIEGN